MQQRHIRNQPAILQAEQAELRSAKICVAGCGGLGGYIVEYLARMGIGALVLVDGDVFEASNLNRQLLCTMDTLGRPKATVAAERVQAIDPDITVTAYCERLTGENGERLLEGCCLAMDALDSVQSRLELARCCEALGIPLVHGAIQGWNMQSTICMPGENRMAALYPRVPETTSKCSLAFTPALCAAVQAAQALHFLLRREPALEEKLLVGDLQEMEFLKLEMQ